MSNLPDPMPRAITWKNTINVSHLPDDKIWNEVVTLSKYPYYCRNGGVWDSKNGCFTGVTENHLDSDLL